MIQMPTKMTEAVSYQAMTVTVQTLLRLVRTTLQVRMNGLNTLQPLTVNWKSHLKMKQGTPSGIQTCICLVPVQLMEMVSLMTS
jgi:hypothetical protein